MSDINLNTGKKKRPASFTVFGIITLIDCSFGIIGALVGCIWAIVISSLWSGLPPMPGAAENSRLAAEAIDQLFAIIIPAVIVGAGASLLFRGLGLAGGIGLLADKKWGRPVCLVFVASLFLMAAAGTVFSIIIFDKFRLMLQGILAEAGNFKHQADQIPFNPARFTEFFFPLYKVMMVLAELVSCIFPLLMVIFLNTKKAKAFVGTL